MLACSLWWHPSPFFNARRRSSQIIDSCYSRVLRLWPAEAFIIFSINCFMCVSVLPACMMYVLQYAHAWGLQKPEEPLELEIEMVMSYLLCRFGN